ncbi:MAG: methyltransferase [Nonlabens sp.]
MEVFKFKHFEIQHDNCSQKVGTDGVLIGAWTQPSITPQTILDVGAGTGLISLICAQRFESAQIDAVELSDDCYEQAASNFENSIWNDRLFCYHASFQEFYEEVEDPYDLIISNPPFFKDDSISDVNEINLARRSARFDADLPFEHLLLGVSQLLSPTGTFAAIIPFDRKAEFLEIAAALDLLPVRLTLVKGTVESKVKRVMLELRFRESVTPTQTNTLIIENSRHRYTEAYKNLCSPFYLYLQ